VDTVHECDRQTDRRTDGRTDRQTELLSQRPCNAERRTVKALKYSVVTLCALCPVAPQIVDTWSSDDVIVEEGDDVTLVCNATGQPQPQVTWRRQTTPTSLSLITGYHRAEDRCQLSDLATGTPIMNRRHIYLSAY